jgi:site-specific recombinase XerD
MVVPKEQDMFLHLKKGVCYSRQQVNRLLKQIFKSKDKNISSHSLRKSFGRRVYEKNNESEKALLMLNEIYNHSSIAQTRAYLDITQEEINSVYESIC